MYSVAMSEGLNATLRNHLLREDGQEDVCLVTYVLSSGLRRTTFILRSAELPRDGERFVHGNASLTGDYVLRVATEAAARGEGLALVHSHPAGRTWQGLSQPDYDTEREYARVAEAVTGYQLLGLTLAGETGQWSARHWTTEPAEVDSIRIVGLSLALSWNPITRPAPTSTRSQIRTVSAWGPQTQADLARLRILVVGLGSVGLDVIQRLAASGVETIDCMDFDTVELLNLDRMIGATHLDARRKRTKVTVAMRLARSAATAANFNTRGFETSITDPDALRIALDYDVIFCCVDRPWARAVLNGLAYSDLIPVIDGGIAIDVFDDGRMRGASWRTQTLVPGRPCLLCSGQIGMTEVQLDKTGDLDREDYIRAAGHTRPAGQNVAALAGSVSASQLAQFVSLLAAPAGIGVPLPLRYALAPHYLEHLDAKSGAYCPYEGGIATGDQRIQLTAREGAWRKVVEDRRQRRLSIRLGRALASLISRR